VWDAQSEGRSRDGGGRREAESGPGDQRKNGSLNRQWGPRPRIEDTPGIDAC